MKARQRLICLIVLGILILTACNTKVQSMDLVKKYNIEDYNMSFMFPENWDKVTTETPYDLQCTDGNSYASIFTYYKSVVSEGESPMDIFDLQNKDIFSVTDNVQTITEIEEKEVDNKIIHSQMYSAKKEGIENYYYFNLIESKEEKNVFAWVMFTALPDYANKRIELWDKIVASAEWYE